MLKTLNKYIEESPAGSGDRRFFNILVLSVACHLIFYAAIIKLDISSKRFYAPRRGGASGLVQIAELASPPNKPQLRTAPAPPERAEISQLEFDRDREDDVNLVSKSAKLGTPQGTGQAPQASRPRLVSTNPRPLVPPQSALVQVNRTPQQVTSVLAQVALPQTVDAPPAPGPNKDASEASATVRDQVRPAASREESAGTRELGLQAIQGQYLAYVRAKISKVNERLMPRDWIKDVLTDKVSAGYEVVIGRGGTLLSVRLIRGSGYQLLDEKGREAIFNARPFEGYPQRAGDTITVYVTVHYSPTFR